MWASDFRTLMKTALFDYTLPRGLIAQEPVEPRDSSRLMVVDRPTAKIEHRHFYDLADYLRPKDCLVVNETRVIPARLMGRKKETGGQVEFLLLREIDGNRWEVLARPGRRLQAGQIVEFDGGRLAATVEERTPGGGRIVRFVYQGDFEKVLEEIGQVPLPPYIEKPLAVGGRYQTIYARIKGSVAAPTAGLHFTDELIDRLRAIGVTFAPVTLDIGLDTFRPVEEENVEQHHIHTERFSLSELAAGLVNEAIETGGRVIAVGTTSVRVLETQAIDKQVKPGDGRTELFIYPGYRFKVVDGLVTNFHLPRSTLLMLVCAFGGRELILRAYSEAIREEYRFYSFGDAVLVL